MRLIRFIPWWLFIVIALLLLLWQFRIQVISYGLSHATADYGVDILNLEIEDINFSRATLSKLDIDIEVNRQQFKIRAGQVKLEYTLDGLKAGKVYRAETEHLLINRSTTAPVSSTTDNKDSFRQALSALLALFRQDLPVQELEINRIDIHDSGASISPHLPIQLSVRSDRDRTSVTLIDSDSSIDVKNHRQQLEANIFSKSFSDTEPIIKLDATLEGDTIDGDFHIKTQETLEWWTGYTPLPDHIRQIDGHLDLKLKAEYAEQNWMTVLSGKTDSLQVNDLSVSGMDFSLHAKLPDNFGSIQNPDLEYLSPSRIAIAEISFPDFEGKNLIFQPEGKMTWQRDEVKTGFSQNSRIKLTSLRTPEITLDNIDASMLSSWTWNPVQTDITLLQGFQANASLIKTDQYRATDPALTVLDESRITIRPESQWLIQDGKWEIKRPAVQLTDQAQPIRGSIAIADIETLSPAETKLVLDMEELETEFQGETYTINQFTVNTNHSSEQLIVKGELQFQPLQSRFSFDGRYHSGNRKGSYRITSDDAIDMGIASAYLNPLIAPWDDKLTIESGWIHLDLAGEWQAEKPFQNSLNIRFEDITGSYDELIFSNLAAQGTLSYPINFSSDSVRIKLDSLEYGVMVNNIGGVIGFEPSPGNLFPALGISDLKGEIFGGQFRAEPFSYHPQNPDTRIPLSIVGLDISEIVETQQIGGLKVTGKLTGTLPVDIDNDGLSINLGHLSNDKEGGVIHYRVDPSQAQAVSNALTDTVIKALEEFHYDLLTAEVAYRPDGQLNINFHIEGKSPGLNTERPVHLNINSEQNVLSLLKSLQYTGNLNDTLDKQLQEKLN